MSGVGIGVTRLDSGVLEIKNQNVDNLDRRQHRGTAVSGEKKIRVKVDAYIKVTSRAVVGKIPTRTVKSVIRLLLAHICIGPHVYRRSCGN